MRLSFQIAARFLKSNKGQTLLIILGIAIGVSVQIFIGALIQGLQKSLVDKTVGSSSQITITAKSDDKRIFGYENILNEINNADVGIAHLSLASDHPAFIGYGNNSESILIRGFNLDQANQIYHLYDQITEGTAPKNENEILLGIGFKEKLGLKVGSEVLLTSTDQTTASYKVVGFLDLKVAGINDSWGIITLPSAQKFFDTGNSVTGIEMQVSWKDVFSADEIAGKLSMVINTQELQIDNWKKQNEQLLSGLQGQSISSIMIQVFVLVSVVLGIASVLAITVIQKSKQIGILKAMGIRNSAASYIFIFEGLLLGVFGAVFGILFGYGLCLSFMKFALNSDGTPVVNISISLSFMLQSGMIAILVSALAAFVPALRSRRLNPIDIIRNN